MVEKFKKSGLMDGASSEWDESEHPRGQPDNKGQFVKKDSSRGGISVVTGKELSDIPDEFERIGVQSVYSATRVEKSYLHNSEWVRYYQTLSEIQAGTLRKRKTKRGDRWVILNANELSDGTRTPPRIIIDNNSYDKPKVKAILTFDDDDRMYDLIDMIWSGYEQRS